MGRYHDPRLKQYIAEQMGKAKQEAKKREAEKKRLEAELAALQKPAETKFDPFSMYGGAKNYKKLSKSQRKEIQKQAQIKSKNTEIAKKAKIADLEKKIKAFPDPNTLTVSKTMKIWGKTIKSSTRVDENYFEKQYFKERSNELGDMVNNVVSSNPDKFSMSVRRDKKGNIVGYDLVNKEKKALMDAELAKAKNADEVKTITKKYAPLVNYKLEDPLHGYNTSPGSNPGWSTGNARSMANPLTLQRLVEGKPFIPSNSATLKTVGIKAKATTGNNNFFGSIGKSIGGALDKVSKATSTFTKPLSTAIKTVGKGTEQIVSSAAKGDIKGVAKAGLGVVEGAKDVTKQAASAGLTTALAPTAAIAGATGLKPLEKLTQNIEAEGQRGIETYGDVATEIGANVATGGTYGAAKGLASGLAQGGLGALVSPEMISKYGVDAAAAYAGVDPSMLKAGLAATQGDIKGAALSSLGSLGGLSPEQMKIASSLSSGKITEAGALAAGLDPNIVKAATSGNLQSVLTSGLSAGLTGATAMYGEQAAAAAGIDLETLKKAQEISKSALSGDLKTKALQELSGAAGLSPQQTSILQAATSGNLKQELTSQAGQAAGLTNEQIQLGRSLASGDTKGLQNMASQYVIKKGDSFNAIAKRLGVDPKELEKANPQLKDINKIAAGAKLNLPKMMAEQVSDQFESTAPIVNETVQQYADRMGLDPNVILEQNKGKGLSLGKPIPRGMEMSLPEGFTPPKVGEGSKGFFSSVGDKLSGAWKSIAGTDKEKGLLGKAKDFIGENKDLINTGVQAGAAYAGYKAGQKGYEEVEELSKKQLKDLQAQGKQFMEITFDPNRYKQERAFIHERIAKGGLTKEEEALQKQGDIRGAKAAAAARLAGVEQQVRLGGGAAMGTSALASSLAGSQALLGEQSQTNLAREQAAAKNLESAIQRQGALSTQETKERADLAQQQGKFGLERTQAVGGVRGDLGNLALEKAAALQRLYGKGADLAAGALGRMQPSQQPAQQPTQQPAPPPPAQNLDTKAGGAQRINNKRVTSGSGKQESKPAIDKFNVANIPTYLKRPETAVQDAKKLAEQEAKKRLDAEKKKLMDQGKEKVKELIPSGLGNIFKF